MKIDILGVAIDNVGAPWAEATVAKEWRRPWRVRGGSPLSWMKWVKAAVNKLGEMGRPRRTGRIYTHLADHLHTDTLSKVAPPPQKNHPPHITALRF